MARAFSAQRATHVDHRASGVGRALITPSARSTPDPGCRCRTPRAAASGERDGEAIFLSERPGFEQLVERGGLLEWAEFAEFSMAPRATVEMHAGAGQPVCWNRSLRGPVRCGRSFPQGISAADQTRRLLPNWRRRSGAAARQPRAMSAGQGPA